MLGLNNPYCLNVLLAIILCISEILFAFSQIRKEKSEITSIVPSEESKEITEITKVFTKPRKITEEEVTYYKEQKICLVCKGKVLGLSYICPECDALKDEIP